MIAVPQEPEVGWIANHLDRREKFRGPQRVVRRTVVGEQNFDAMLAIPQRLHQCIKTDLRQMPLVKNRNDDRDIYFFGLTETG